ncbi:hypothetical protein ACQEVF_48670 [Nonomuraea polychroma]|uniref:hypothetical protein n=1 Tax=Nonomuraea polychroma TaxID=46176 RepID=UPI003D949A08
MPQGDTAAAEERLEDGDGQAGSASVGGVARGVVQVDHAVLVVGDKDQMPAAAGAGWSGRRISLWTEAIV